MSGPVRLLPPDHRSARLRGVRLLLIGLLTLFAGQTFRIQVVNSDSYAAKLVEKSIVRVPIAPERGAIYDRRGHLLAGNAEFETVIRGRKRVLKRIHPWGNVGAVVLGTLNREGQPAMGLELSADKDLKGLEGWQTWRQDASGRKIDLVPGGEYPPIRGKDVVLTIDKEMQEMVEGALHEGVDAVEGSRGVALVIDPYTGDILAMAVYPGFDPDDHAGLTDERTRNDALKLLHEPGSIVKALTAAAAMEEGLIARRDTFDVSAGYYEVAGQKIRDSHRMGKLSFPEALAQSSNVAFAMISERLGKDKLFQYLRNFGLGNKTGIDLPGEEKGQLKQVHEWSGRTLQTMAMGHELLVTPLQMAMAFSAIANGGALMEPRLVKEYRDGETGEKIGEKESHMVRQVISPETAATLRKYLAGVVEPGGTAANIFDPRFSLCGKTGTAEKYDPTTKKYLRNVNTATFVGMFPVDQPELVVYAMVDEPKINSTVGGRVAGPIFKKIVERIRYSPELDGGVAVTLKTDARTVDFIGTRVDSALQLCSHRGWVCKSFGKGDRVVWQQPAAGAVLIAGDTVKIGRSRPDAEKELIGWPLRDAVELLERRGMSVEWEGRGRVRAVESVDSRRYRLLLEEAT